MNKKFILLLITAVFFVGVISFFSYSRSQTSPVSNQTKTKNVNQNSTDEEWLRYENNDYNFVMYYPSGWSSGSSEGKKDTEIIFTPRPSSSIGSQIEQIFVSFRPNSKKQSSLDYFKSKIEPGQLGSPCTNFKINEKIPQSLNKYDVTIVEGLCGIFNENPLAIINHKGNFIILNASFDLQDTSHKISYELFYDIISKLELK